MQDIVELKQPFQLSNGIVNLEQGGNWWGLNVRDASICPPNLSAILEYIIEKYKKDSQKRMIRLFFCNDHFSDETSQEVEENIKILTELAKRVRCITFTGCKSKKLDWICRGVTAGTCCQALA